MNTGVHVSFSVMVFSGYMPSSRIVGSYGSLLLVFKGISILFSTVAVSIYILTNSARGFPFFTPSPAFTVCKFIDAEQHEVIPYCSFDLHFSNNE